MTTTPSRNRPITNRDFKLPADDWYEIETRGEHFNPEAGVVQVIDDAAIDAIVNRFAQLKAEPDFSGILIDRDHFSLDTAKSSRAAGWLLDVRKAGRGYEGKVRWSESGRKDVEGGEFRFFSTVYPPPDECQPAGERKIANRKKPVRAIRPLELDRLAITNDPNNKGGKPISNRGAGDGGAVNHEPDNSSMKHVNKELGLAEDAQEQSAVAEIGKIKNRATTAESQVVALTKERDDLLKVQVEADLEKFQGVIKNREKWKAALIANRASAIELLESLNAEDGDGDEGDETKRKQITNRRQAQPPAGGGGDANAERAKAQKITNRAHELKGASPTRTFDSCWQQAQHEAAAPKV